MRDRQKQDCGLPPAPVWARNTLGTFKTSRSALETPHPTSKPHRSDLPSDKPASSTSINTFHVLSPSSSEEEENGALEDGLSDSGQPQSFTNEEIRCRRESDDIAKLGDSSSLFATPPTAEHFTFRSTPPTANMVVEREPPKGVLSPQKKFDGSSKPVLGDIPQQPEFGKASPLRGRVESGPFIIPKPHQPRPEHHRFPQPLRQPLEDLQNRPAPEYAQATGQLPQHPYLPHRDHDFVEIPKPTNFPEWSTKPTATPLFSSRGGGAAFTAVDPPGPANFVDLTTAQPLLDDHFGSVDPYDFVDAGKANENIKALLEGVFEDEDDKPRTRGRKKKIEAGVESLTDKLQGLEVKAEAKVDDATIEEEEDDDEDDGTVEGLKVKLLPHQVDGVAWMKDKEIGVKKKNKVLPKGGILADDVSSAILK